MQEWNPAAASSDGQAALPLPASRILALDVRPRGAAELEEFVLKMKAELQKRLREETFR